MTSTTPKRRGRRPGGQDTRTALMEAARAVFAESGYEGATVRAIATRADVDAAMVNHWFGGKAGLFAEAVLQLPVNPSDVVAEFLDGPPEKMGERIVRRFLAVWDTTGGDVFTALIRSVTTNDQAQHVIHDFFVEHVFGAVLAATGSDQAQLRATLCATQIVGLGMVRYVARFEPLDSAAAETVVTAIAPTIQRYLTGPIS